MLPETDKIHLSPEMYDEFVKNNNKLKFHEQEVERLQKEQLKTLRFMAKETTFKSCSPPEIVNSLPSIETTEDVEKLEYDIEIGIDPEEFQDASMAEISTLIEEMESLKGEMESDYDDLEATIWQVGGDIDTLREVLSEKE